MAQSGFTPISLYYSSTGAAVPSAGNLVAGELALNTNDGKLYYKNSSGVVTLLAGATSGPAGGSTTQVQYNNAGVLAGITGATTNGTALTLVAPVLGTPASGTVTNLTGTASININGTVGATTPAAGAFTTLTSTLDATIYGVTVGRGAGAVSTNTAVGASALVANTSGADNTATGYQAGYTNVSGVGGTFLGMSAGYFVTGSYNTAIGRFSGGTQATSAGTNNTSVGNAAGYKLTSGSFNTAIGDSALLNNTTASNNTAVGYQASYNNTASNNTAVGYQAGYHITTGAKNVLIGDTAGSTSSGDLTTGSNNILIGGARVSTSAAAGTQQIVVGTAANVVGKGDSTGFISPNGGGVYQGNNLTLWSVTSDQRLKKNIVDNNVGLEKITAIQVRNFEYRLPEEVDAELKPSDAIKKEGVQLGVIAQELQAVLPDCVKTESTGVMSVNSDALMWHMLNAIKELSAKVTALENK